MESQTVSTPSAMLDSILTSIKKLLGIAEDYTSFDPDVVMHINTAFSILNQIGVGPSIGFSISDSSSSWDDYLGDETLLEMVKTYVYLKVKLVFDPPLSSAVIEAMKQTIAELEWRIQVAVESTEAVT